MTTTDIHPDLEAELKNIPPPQFQFAACLHLIEGRGRPPLSFLAELVTWGRSALKASPEIFAPNQVAVDAYAVIKSSLGTLRSNDGSGTPVYGWDSLLHRTAAMLELMRVHAGRESSWKWEEGVDKTNKRSMANKTGQETGIFQVSFDSENLGHEAMKEFAKDNDILDVDKFLPAMKKNHTLAMEYYARLVRINIAWAGPLIRHNADSVYPYLNRDSMREFWGLLK